MKVYKYPLSEQDSIYLKDSNTLPLLINQVLEEGLCGKAAVDEFIAYVESFPILRVDSQRGSCDSFGLVYEYVGIEYCRVKYSCDFNNLPYRIQHNLRMLERLYFNYQNDHTLSVEDRVHLTNVITTLELGRGRFDYHMAYLKDNLAIKVNVWINDQDIYKTPSLLTGNSFNRSRPTALGNDIVVQPRTQHIHVNPILTHFSLDRRTIQINLDPNDRAAEATIDHVVAEYGRLISTD